MTLQQAIVNQENQFLVSCPHCTKIIRMSVADLQDTDRLFKVFGLQSVYICQCKCNKKFNLKIDMRLKIRRNVGLPGYFTNPANVGLKDKFYIMCK